MKSSIFKIISLVLLVILSAGCLKEETINLDNVSTHEYYDLNIDIPDDLKLSSNYEIETGILPYELYYNESHCSLNLSSLVVEDVDFDHLREGIGYYLNSYMMSLEGESSDIQFVNINEHEWAISAIELDGSTSIFYCTYYNGRSYTIVFKYDNKSSEDVGIWEDINLILYYSLKFR